MSIKQQAKKRSLSCLNNIETSTNTNVAFNDIPQTHSLEQHSHENPQLTS